MSRPSLARRFTRSMVLALVAVGLAGAPLAAARAAEKFSSALEWVPADAAFYSSSLRDREVIEIIGNSKAWEKFKNIPSIQFVWSLAELQMNQPGGPLDTVKQLFQLPENQQLLDLGIDMVSHEMVVYGDPSVAASIDLLVKTINSAQYAGFARGLKEGATGKDEDDDESAKGGQVVMDALAERPDVISVPNFILAFKITNTERAKTQLKRLEVLAGLALQQKPELKERLKRVEIGGGDYLTLTLDGKLVPSWDEVDREIKKLERKPGDYAKVFEKIKQLTVAVTIGVRGDYLLLSIGKSNDHLAALGKGRRLADLPELAPVLAAAGKRLTNISYLSKTMHSVLASQKQNIDEMSKMARKILPSTELDAALQKRIAADVDRFGQDVKRYLPEIGAAVQFSYLTDRGTETYTYDHSQNPMLDGTKRIEMLDHVGGSPLLAFVARSKSNPEDYDLMVKWLKVGYAYADEFATKQIPPEKQAQYKELVEFAKPLVARLDKANRTMLIPALADHQGGIVLDAKITSNQWHKQMPKVRQPLPMFELGFVRSVSDAELYKQGIAEYKAVADEIVKKIKELNPGAIPADYTIPLPKSRKVGAGTIYSYEFPESGLDQQLTLSAGLSSKVLVMTTSPKMAERALTARPLAAGGALTDTTRPLAMAVFFDWAATVDTLRPWIDLGVRYYGAQAAAAAGDGGLLAIDDANLQKLIDGENDSDSTKAILDQVHTGLEILQTLRTVTSATYLEKGVTVRHTEVQWQDVK